MPDKYSVSVVICTYNPDETKLLRTLYSIISQKEIDFELIITDDGSKVFPVEKVTAFFSNNDFSQYKLNINEINKGTVHNYYSGLKQAQGKYVKVISPGDYLYDSLTLRKFYDYCEENGAEICFGKCATYYEEDGELNLYKFSAPSSVESYRKLDLNGMINGYFKYKDLIIGAALFCKTKLNLRYLERILDKVIYDEGMAYVLMLAEEVKIHFCDEFIVWYEFGYGISSDFSSRRQRILNKDVLTAYNMAAELSDKAVIKKAADRWFGSSLSRFISRIRSGLRRRLVKLTVKDYNDYANVDTGEYYRIVSGCTNSGDN